MGHFSSADPTFSKIPELVESPGDSDAEFHPGFLDKVTAVTKDAGIQLHRVLLLDKPKYSSSHLPYPVPRDLASDFQDGDEHVTERGLTDGSAITKPAFYLISHCLSGRPKE